MRVYVFGLQGVGKTEISKYLALKYNAKHFSGSEIMMRICNVNSRDELRSLDIEIKKDLERKYYIPFLEDQGDIIVDGHGSLNNEQVDFFDEIIFLSCEPELLQKRRLLDNSRNDRVTDLVDITNEVEIYKEKIKVLESQGAFVYHVDNNDNIKFAIDRIERIIENSDAEVDNDLRSEYNKDTILN